MYFYFDFIKKINTTKNPPVYISMLVQIIWVYFLYSLFIAQVFLLKQYVWVIS